MSATALYRLNVFVDGLTLGFILMLVILAWFMAREQSVEASPAPQRVQYCDIA